MEALSRVQETIRQATDLQCERNRYRWRLVILWVVAAFTAAFAAKGLYQYVVTPEAVNVPTTKQTGRIVVDRNGVVTQWTTSAERITGWTAADMSGQRFESIVKHPELFRAAFGAAGRHWPERDTRLYCDVWTKSGTRMMMARAVIEVWQADEAFVTTIERY